MRACARCLAKDKLVGVRKKHSWYENGWWRDLYHCVCGHHWMVKRKVEDVDLQTEP